MDNKFRIVYFLFLLLLSSCAQVEGISGGPKDTIAPRVKKITPENQTVNFTARKITFEFDEFVKLNNPNENIVIMPSGLKVNVSLHKKTVELNLEGNFSENTTYQINLNGVVKDNREGNDSLMRYVFSTGNFLDSLSYSGKIVDAYTNELQNNITVGLYQEKDSITAKPLYFVRTNNKGEFLFENLKPAKYQLYAFNDINKDLSFQYNEKVGFSLDAITIDSNRVDSVAFRIFQNNLPKKIKEKKLIYPRKLIISTTYPLIDAKLVYSDKEIENEAIYYYKEDSIAVFLHENPKETDFLLIERNGSTDTLNFVTLQKNLEQKPVVEFFPSNKDISKDKKLTLIFSDQIESINNELIEIQTIDSVKIATTIQISKNKLVFTFPDSLKKEILFKIKAEALLFTNKTKNDLIDTKIICKSKESYASLLFKNKNFPENALLEFILNNKVVLVLPTKQLQTNPLISQLDAGEYVFRLIFDENKNQKWDVGDVFSKIPAEKISYFTQKVKLRANWETELELILSDSLPE